MEASAFTEMEASAFTERETLALMSVARAGIGSGRAYQSHQIPRRPRLCVRAAVLALLSRTRQACAVDGGAQPLAAIVLVRARVQDKPTG